MITEPHTVLAVDDCADDLLLLRQAFRKHNRADMLREVTSGPEALAYLVGDHKFSDRAAFPFPDLLLVDVKMPAMNGLEFLEQFNRLRAPRKPRVIVLSTSRMPSDIDSALKLGASDYISKPVCYSDFVRLVGDILQSFKCSSQPVSIAGRSSRCDDLNSVATSL